MSEFNEARQELRELLHAAPTMGRRWQRLNLIDDVLAAVEVASQTGVAEGYEHPQEALDAILGAALLEVEEIP